MRWTLGTLVVIGIGLAVPAYAQQPPAPITCEQQVKILTQLARDVTAQRNNAEIEIAALKVQFQTLTQQIEAAKTANEQSVETKAK